MSSFLIEDDADNQMNDAFLDKSQVRDYHMKQLTDYCRSGLFWVLYAAQTDWRTGG